MHQRVQKNKGTRRTRRLYRARRYPVALTCKGIGRQTDPAWPVCPIEVLPVERQALDPQVEQFAELALGHPCLDDGFHIVVAGQGSQGLFVALDLATIEIVDGRLTRDIGTQFRAQFGQRTNHQA
ncbi:hypothetical protein DYGSA30_32790 [Dyella sp. GSA-30]|nr:hypothetical protein DYGSA30_32790 [Dyella sp. GSA-30]